MQVSFLGLLAIVFIVLELTGTIDWSWFWVLSPIWGGFVVMFMFVAVLGAAGKRAIYLAAGLTLAAAASALAQPMPMMTLCAPREHAVRALGEVDERQLLRGPTTGGGLLEVWVSKSGDSWSVLVTLPDGRTCMIAQGTDLDSGETAEPGQPDQPS